MKYTRLTGRNRSEGKQTMDADATSMMSGVEYTYDELVDALNAEAATLPPETWRCRRRCRRRATGL